MSQNRFAVVDSNGVVTNLIAYDGISETSYDPAPVPINDLSVSVGDRFAAGEFFIRPRDGFEYEFIDGTGWRITAAGQAAKDAAEIATASQEKEGRLSYANQITADWRTELALGMLEEEDEEKLKAWMVYIKALKALNLNTAPDITWPEPPAA